HVARDPADYGPARPPSQPQWLARTREAALANFERRGFPSTRHEDCRFPPVGPIAQKPFVLATDGVAKADTRLTARLAADATLAVSVNGRFAPLLSSLDTLPKGVQILGLEAAIASNPGLVDPYLARLASSDQQPFTALNTAFLRDGVVIAIAAHTVVEAPIEVVFVSVAEGRPTVAHPRFLIIAGESSQARILERYVGSGGTFTNAITEVVLGANAVIDHYKVQEEQIGRAHV